MSHDPDVVSRRLDELERRLGAVERLVVGCRAASVDLGFEVVAARPVTPRGGEKRDLVAEVARPAVLPNPAPVKVAVVPAQLTPKVDLPPVVSKPRTESLERLIGGRFYAAIGAIVVVVGVGMFLKLAVQRGWFSFPPVARCVSAAGFGLLLLVAGEIARKKISAAASVGLSAAGIATVWASGLAAFGLYKLVGAGAAFGLLAAASVLGVLVALRARQALLAGLSLVAAYLTPIVLWRGDLSPLVLPIYLLAVLGFGLWLSGWRPTPFRAVRTIVWWGTVLLGTAWGLEHATHNAFLVVAFLGLVWVAVHAELVFGSMRQRETEREWSELYSNLWNEARPIVRSFGTTIWAVGLGVLAARLGRGNGGGAPPDWFVAAGGFIGACIAGLMLAGTLRTLRDAPESDSERLGAGLIMQAGALLIATVAMAAGSWTQVVCWLAMGVAGVASAKWIRSRPLSVYGLILLMLGVTRLVVWDWWHTPPTGVAVLGLFLTPWSLLMALAGVACAAAGGVLMWNETSVRWRTTGELCIAAAWTLLFGAVLHPTDATAAVGFVGAGACLGLLGTGAAVRSRVLTSVGIGYSAITSVAMMMANVGPMSRSISTISVGGLMLTPLSAVVLVMTSVWVCAGLVIWKRSRAGALACVGIAWTLVFGSVMHSRAEVASLGFVGAAVCLGVVLTAWKLRSRGLAHVGATYLAIGSAGVLLRHMEPALTGVSAVKVLGLEFTRLSAVVTVFGVVWVLAAWVWRAWSRGVAIACLSAAAAMGMFLPRLLGSSDESVCLWWLALSMGLVGLHALRPRAAMDVMGLAGLLLAASAWAVMWPVRGWVHGVNADGIHGGFWVAFAWCWGAAAAAVWLTGGRLTAPSLRRFAANEDTRVKVALAWSAVGTVFFVATSFEVARVAGLLMPQDRTSQGAAVSIWWGLYAAVLLAIGFIRKVAPVRHFGLGLLGVATAKAVVFDLADVGAEWRVASFLGLGLLMLGVAVVYGRVSKRLMDDVDLEVAVTSGP